MKIANFVAMLGSEKPWHAWPRDEFAAYLDSEPTPAWPWFVMNIQETIQFRMVGSKAEAVFVRHEEIDRFEGLREQLETLGFVFERRQTLRVSGIEATENWYRKDHVRVQIPEQVTSEPGFMTAVTIECVR